MEFHDIKMVGDFKTDNIKSKDGVSAVEIDNSTGKYTIKTNLKIESGSPGSGKRLTSDADGDVSFDNPSVPSGEIILFEKDTVVSGYSLLTSIDDEVVYITKGSASGGETGGNLKSGSTWTQPSHTHTGPSHTHTGPSHTHTGPSHTHTITNHNHQWFSHQGTSADDKTYDVSGNAINLSHGSKVAGNECIHVDTIAIAYLNIDGYTSNSSGNTGSAGTGDTGSAGTGATGSAGTGATGSSATANTWRPTGRNYTRQQRS